MRRIELAGAWTMQSSDGRTCPARLPGSNFSALIQSGAIEDPLTSGSEQEALQIAGKDFAFLREFTLTPEELDSPHIHLCCGGLDTLCTCFVNGREAFQSSSAFLPVDRDIRPLLQAGRNEICLRFASPVRYIARRQRERPLQKNGNGLDGFPYIRKPACHFGWDWGPCVPCCAVVGYIELRCFHRRIENIEIRQSTTAERSVVRVKADHVDHISLFTPAGEEIPASGEGEFTVARPELWYTRELSQRERQPLYTVRLENGEETVEKRIGLRSIGLAAGEDAYGRDFCIVLNGQRLFAKGASLIPFSAVYSGSENEAADRYLELARRGNFNLIRVWGGGSYAPDYLLERCDEQGLLVWQDLPFACQMYPLYEPSFHAQVLEEIEANVRRMAAHPCLALWCGNNELEELCSYMPRDCEEIAAYGPFFYRELPELLEPLTDVPYIPTSPAGREPFQNCSGDDAGDAHNWDVWHGLRPTGYFLERFPRFLSEFGLGSLPSMKALRTFLRPEESSLFSPPMEAHQKCSDGNRKLLYYLTEFFEFPRRFEDIPHLSGLAQAEGVRKAVLHLRQNKGRCNGAVYWQFNDVWNCPSWSSVDYEGVPKALQYRAKEFFAPVTVSCRREGKRAVVFAHNDTLEPAGLQIRLEGWNPRREKTCQITLAPGEVRQIDCLPIRSGSILQFRFRNEIVTETFDIPRRLRLKKSPLRAELCGQELVLRSKSFACGVFIDSDQLPEDNYFSMAPGETRRIAFPCRPERWRVSCVNDVPFRRPGWRRWLFRWLYGKNQKARQLDWLLAKL